MTVTFQCDECAVFDEVLDAPAFGALFACLRSLDFRFAHETPYHQPEALRRSYKRVWRFDEQNPLSGPSYAAVHPDTPEANRDAMQEVVRRWTDAGMTFYPTQTPIDALLMALQHMAVERLSEWVGQAGRDWHLFTATPQLYPQHTGLSWHADALLYTGSFSYFAHPEWEPDFGGELLIGRRSATPGDMWKNRLFDPLSHRFPDNRPGREREQAVSDGHFILPLPNRLVVIRRGVLHKVNKVSALAGSHVRTTVTGFFVAAETTQRSKRA